MKETIYILEFYKLCNIIGLYTHILAHIFLYIHREED